MDESHPESEISFGYLDVSFGRVSAEPSYAERNREYLAYASSQYRAEPVNLEWRDLSLSVPLGRSERNDGAGKYAVMEKEVLRRVTGSVRCGQMLAIMGASGAGKTSLLNILAGRADGTQARIQGCVNVNGEARDWEKFRLQTAYVLQDDAMFGELTVEEQVMFSAGLRLPALMPRAAKKARVDRILNELGLDEVRDRPIGGKFVRGVSGGERKRVAIATEIVTDPSVLFLDEPTSGLDSANALRVMQTLHHLAAHKRTVVCTIHQPRSAIFALFDHILLLSEGRVMYHGPARQACAYFSTLGFNSPPAYNPADFLVDLLTVNRRSIRAEMHSMARVQYIAERHRPHAAGALMSDEKAEADWLQWRASFDWEAYIEGQHLQENRRFQNAWLIELAALLVRAARLLARAKVVNIMRLFQVLVFGLLLGAIWLNKGRETTLDARRAIPGVLFFIAINQSGAAYSVLFAFPLERTIVTRERAANMYRTSSYFLAKTVMDTVKSTIFTLIFCGIVYGMVGFRAGVVPFLLFFLAVLMITVFAESLALAVSVLTGNAQAASSLVTVFIVLFLLFGGFFIGERQMPAWIAPLQWSSCMFYTYNALMDAEFPPTSADPVVQTVRREAALNPLTYWQNIAVLAAMTAALKFVAFLLLRHLRAPKFYKF